MLVRDPYDDDDDDNESQVANINGKTKAEAMSKASVHPSSVAARVSGKGWEGWPFCAYHERVLTTKVYMRDVTPLPLLALPLLCGGNVVVVVDEEDETGKGGTQAMGGGGKGGGSGGARWCTLVVDGWLRLQVPAAAAPTVIAARKQVGDRLRGLVTIRKEAQETTAGNNNQGGGGDAGGLVAALSALVEMKANAVVVAQPGAHRPNKNAQKRATKRPAVAARKLRRGEAKQESGSIGSIQSTLKDL